MIIYIALLRKFVFSKGFLRSASISFLHVSVDQLSQNSVNENTNSKVQKLIEEKMFETDRGGCF